jgi:hypothetical protein
MKISVPDLRLTVLVMGITGLCLWSVMAVPGLRMVRAEEDAEIADAPVVDLAPTTLSEARGRARLLHEVLRGSLQVMHRDFFDEENPPAIPSASLEDVFAELERSHQVRVKWLNVETDVLNVDHKPADAFETAAARALKGGKTVYEASEDGQYRFAGRIHLASQCLKCHIKARTSTEPRSAGVVISMPLQNSSSQ